MGNDVNLVDKREGRSTLEEHKEPAAEGYHFHSMMNEEDAHEDIERKEEAYHIHNFYSAMSKELLYSGDQYSRYGCIKRHLDHVAVNLLE